MLTHIQNIIYLYLKYLSVLQRHNSDIHPQKTDKVREQAAINYDVNIGMYLGNICYKTSAVFTVILIIHHRAAVVLGQVLTAVL